MFRQVINRCVSNKSMYNDLNNKIKVIQNEMDCHNLLKNQLKKTQETVHTLSVIVYTGLATQTVVFVHKLFF